MGVSFVASPIKLRELPKGWTETSIGNIAQSVQSGKSSTTPTGGDVPIYGSTGRIGWAVKADYYGEAILIARVGANAGRLAVVDGEYCVSDNTIILRLDNTVPRSYVWRQLEALNLNSLVYGSGQPLITGTQIKGLFVPLPPTKAEQEAIAEALSDADAYIESLEKLIAKKRLIKQGAMQELLTGKRRLPGFSGEWTSTRIGDIAGVVMGQSPSSSAYNRSGIGLPLIQGNADIENRKTIKRVYTSDVTKMGLSGDTIMSVRAPVGAIARTHFDVCLGRGVCAIRFQNDFLYWALLSKEKQWSSLSTGSTFDSVNSSEVNAFRIPFPKVSAEQITISTILNDLEYEISRLSIKQAKARQVKQGMMQELLTGRIRLV